EELALAIGAVKVVHWHLAKAGAGIAELLDQLDGNGAAVGLELHLLPQAAAEQAEEMMVNAPDNDAMERVAARKFVAVDDVDGVAAVAQRLHQLDQLVRIVL